MQQNQNRIKSFVDNLSIQDVDSEIVFNQYHEDYNFPHFFTTKTNLLLYLTQMKEKEPKTVLIGEAPGKKGCALTGIPFTSLDIISKQNKFGLFGFPDSQQNNNLQKENTATMVWNILEKLDFCPLLWNAYPFNPVHQVTKKNRKPTIKEIEIGKPFLKELINIYNISNYVAVGKIASAFLDSMGINHFSVSHPSYGNKKKFYDGLKKLIDEKNIGA